MKNILYQELSYAVVGIMFDVFNCLGSGLKENIYEKAIAVAFQKKGIQYRRQVYCPIFYKGEKVAYRFLDFLVENVIVIELKNKRFFASRDFQQIKDYLKITNLKLGILVSFSTDQLKYSRVINIY